MKIIFLGTNGWFTTSTGDTPCILIDSKDYYVVLDAGNGIYKLGQYIKDTKPIYLFLSHLHLDHIFGIHIIDKFKFPQGINIILPPGRKKDFEKVIAPPFTHYYYDFGVKVTLTAPDSLPFSASVIEQFHSGGDHGIKLNLEDKVIAYSGDTGITDASLRLAESVDLLIHECTWPTKKDENWGHTTPEGAAHLAKRAGIKQLILTHFDANEFDTLEKRKKAEQIAKAIFPNTIAATDGLIITI